MSTTENIYGKYDLETRGFDADRFDETWGNKLIDLGHQDIYDSIRLEGMNRQFLQGNLSKATLDLVNAGETLTAAKSAELFQSRIAETVIVDNREPLVDLRTVDEQVSHGWTFTDATYHEACGEWAGRPKLFLVRKTVADRLLVLAEELDGLDTRIHYEDGFRPLGVQEGLFSRRIAMARSAHPEWSDEELVLEARSKTAYTPRFAAHKAGAAVDLRLISTETNEVHDIGHGYPDGGEIVRLDSPFTTQEQWQNRKILEHLAKSSGLFMYPFEDWHLCYGDATAAAVQNPDGPYLAQYGPVKSFDATTGAITEVYSEHELDTTFPLDEWKSE